VWSGGSPLATLNNPSMRGVGTKMGTVAWPNKATRSSPASWQISRRWHLQNLQNHPRENRIRGTSALAEAGDGYRGPARQRALNLAVTHRVGKA
jgi:hypothetical protein